MKQRMIHLDWWEWTVEAVSLALVLGLVVHVVVAMPSLPDTIPTHFDGRGVPDIHGSKSKLWAVPIVSGSVYVALWVLSLIVFLVSDAGGFMSTAPRLLRLFSAGALFSIGLGTVRSAQGKSSGLAWLAPATLLVLVVFVASALWSLWHKRSRA